VTAPSRSRRPSVPWSPNDLVRLVVLSLLAITGIGIAWYQTSGTGRLSEQLSWLNLSIASLVVASLANLMWIMNGRRSVGLRRQELLDRWDIEDERVTTGRFAVEPEPPVAAPRSGVLVRADGMAYAHDPSCPLVIGKETTVVTEASPPLCVICHP